MRTLAAYLFLLISLNVVLFHPMVGIDGLMHSDSHDPVNSITEFVVEVCFNIEDIHPGDEREAESEHFNVVKLLSTFQSDSIQIIRQNFFLENTGIPVIQAAFFSQQYALVHTPPPELNA